MAGTKRKRVSTHTFSSDPIHQSDTEWPTPKRRDVKRMKKLGYTGSQIRTETNIPRSTQYTIYEPSTRRPGKSHSGAPCKLDNDTIKKMIHSLQGRYLQRIKDWDTLAPDFAPVPAYPPLEFGPPLSSDSVRHHMNRWGYHKCRACQKSWISQDQAGKRKSWCQEHHWPEWKWKMVYISQVFKADPGEIDRK